MKQLILHYTEKEYLAIKLFLLLLFSMGAYGQGAKIDSEKQEAYYKIVSNIVEQKSNSSTENQLDSRYSVALILENAILRQTISHAIHQENSISQTFGSEKLSTALDALNPFYKLDSSKINSTILLSEKGQSDMQFSGHLIIDNYMLFYFHKEEKHQVLVYDIENIKTPKLYKIFPAISTNKCSETYTVSHGNLDFYYAIINDIVLKDSASLAKRTKRAEKLKISEEKRNHLIEHYTQNSLVLNRKQSNANLKQYLMQNIKEGGELLNYFCSEGLETMLETFPNESIISKDKLSPKIKERSQLEQAEHVFSSPVFINNYILVYHAKHNGINNHNSQLLLYDCSGQKPVLLKRFYASFS